MRPAGGHTGALALDGLTSACVAAFQVPVTRRTAGIRQARRAAVVSGAALAGCCLLFAAASRPGAALASLLVVVAGLVHVGGELYFVGARWGLSVALMDSRQTGAYQGAAATGEAAVQAIGPAVVSPAVGSSGVIGRLLPASVFAAAGVVTPPLAGWAWRRTRRVRTAARC